tara:strand:+ start:7157 stop:7588 length:432 start_codon:yes stop_codon:yes gene_type:complete
MSVDAKTRLMLEDLMTEFAWRVDNGQADRVHELFTEKGRIKAPGLELDGREEIARVFGERAQSSGRVSRHLWSNPRFELIDESSVRVTTVVQTFFFTLEAGDQAPAANNNFIVGDSIDVMRREDDGCWRFESRQLQVCFAPQP